MFTVSYTYLTKTGTRVTATHYFRDQESAIEHAEYIRQLHRVPVTIS